MSSFPCDDPREDDRLRLSQSPSRRSIRQSPLAILFNRRNLSQDEDLATVHLRDCGARVRESYGRNPCWRDPPRRPNASSRAKSKVIRWSQKFLAKFARFVPETISGAARNFERRMRAREARPTVCDRRRDGLVMSHFFLTV